MGLLPMTGPSAVGWSTAQSTWTTTPRMMPAHWSSTMPWRSSSPTMAGLTAGAAAAGRIPLTGAPTTTARTAPTSSLLIDGSVRRAAGAGRGRAAVYPPSP